MQTTKHSKTQEEHKTPSTKFGAPALKKIWSMLPVLKRKSAVKLWLMMVIGMAFEMLGVGLVVPVVALLMQQNIAANYPFLKSVITFLGNPSQQTLLIFAMSALVVVYFVKNIYLAFLAWQQSRFITQLQSELSQKLFAIYLTQPYTFHLQRNSAHLVRNVQGEMSMFINSSVSQYIGLFAEISVAVGLFALLFVIEPVGTLTVFGVLLIVGGLFQRFTKHHITAWGKQRQNHEGYRVKQLQQGLGGAKDVKLLGREKEFLNQYRIHTEQAMKMGQLQYFMQQMPRLWLEILAIIGITLLMLTMLSQQKTMGSALPTLALFAAVCFRLMPSANRILAALQQIRFSAPALDLIHHELGLQEDNTKLHSKIIPNDDPLKKVNIFKSKIELIDVSYTYPNAKKPALNQLSLSIKRGELIGFIGESGSGKSTLIDLMIGLLTPEKGQLLVDDVNIHQNIRSWQNQIGYVPQSIYLTDETLRRNIAFGLAEEDIDDEAVNRALTAAQLQKFVSGLADGVNTVVGERGVRLSGGQRQRIGIARALYHDPEILVLDEATSALDVETESQVMDAVLALQGQKTILIVAHRLSTVERCDRLYKLDSGLIIQ